MTALNPFSTSYSPDPSDEQLTERALCGERSALELLLRRHQPWIYNVALRMLHLPHDAEDATQESLLKIATRLGTFRGESSFRTWAYRIAFHHVLDCKRSRPEQVVTGFDCYRDYFARTPDEPAPEIDGQPETQSLLEEAKLSCTMGMLLCLDREQRMAFVLGEIFDASDSVGAEVLGINRDAFRQRLSRARQQLNGFLHDQCGLMDPNNPCRCARKTRAFIRDGIVDPKRLLFVSGHVKRVKELSSVAAVALEHAAEHAARALYQEHPFYDPPDIAARLQDLMSRSGIEQGAARTCT
jgi:RNA polymerase sigma factor (sigma-70 family)